MTEDFYIRNYTPSPNNTPNVKDSYTLGYGHPDYKYTSWLPRVNLICVRCNKVFPETFLKSDFGIFSAQYIGWRRKAGIKMQRVEEMKRIFSNAQAHTERCKGHNKHNLRRLHRITSFKLPVEQFHRYGDRLPNDPCGIRLELLSDTQILLEFQTNKVYIDCEHQTVTLQPRVTVRCLDGSQVVNFNEEYHSIYEKESICFIGPMGFEVNPIEEIEDEDFEQIWNEYMNKLESLRRERGKALGVPLL